jgi:hypothetical protein
VLEDHKTTSKTNDKNIAFNQMSSLKQNNHDVAIAPNAPKSSLEFISRISKCEDNPHKPPRKQTNKKRTRTKKKKKKKKVLETRTQKKPKKVNPVITSYFLSEIVSLSGCCDCCQTDVDV